MSEVTINVPVYFSLLFSGISSSIFLSIFISLYCGQASYKQHSCLFNPVRKLNLLTEKFSSLILTEIVYVLNFFTTLFLPFYLSCIFCLHFSLLFFGLLKIFVIFSFLLFTHLKVYTATYFGSCLEILISKHIKMLQYYSLLYAIIKKYFSCNQNFFHISQVKRYHCHCYFKCYVIQ